MARELGEVAVLGGAGSVRAMRAAVIEAVLAARAADQVRFAEAVSQLAAQDQQRLRLVQGQLVRELLEELHPDGLSAAEAGDALEHCVRAVAGWYPAVDATVLVTALMGSLGAHDPDEQPPLAPAVVAAHGSLLIADLLSGKDDPASTRPAGPAGPAGPAADADADAVHADRLATLVDRAFAEIQRAETIELP